VSTFSRALRVTAIALLSLAVLRCAPPGECLRFSDCAQGLTCDDGKCVAPPVAPTADGSTDAGAGEAGSDSGAVDAAADGVTPADAASGQEAGDGCVACSSPPDGAAVTNDATAD
jgi:hypothetical protein